MPALVRTSLVLALVLACVPACSEAPAETTSRPQPSTPLEPIAPSGEIAGAFSFSWRGVSDDAIVRIYIVDAAERAITEFDARGRFVTAPQAVLDALTPGKAMGWRVAVIDENGRPARLSRLMRFTWEPGSH